MKKQWNKDIHDRLKDFQVKAPEGLLDDIKSEMSRRGLSSVPVERKSQPVILRLIATAAMILALFGISYLFFWEEATVVPKIHENKTSSMTTERLPIVEESKEEVSPIPATSPMPRLLAQAKQPKTSSADTTSIINEEHFFEKHEEEEKEPEEKEKNESQDRETQPKNKEYEYTPKKQIWTYPPTKRKSSPFAIGVYYSGTVAQSVIAFGKESFSVNTPANDPNDDNFGSTENVGNPDNNGGEGTGSNTPDTTSVASRSASRSFSRKKHSEKAKHHLPIRLGISLRYNLNERWNIQSGLTYSYLASDLSYKGTTPYETKQKLHYIGIPLQIGYRIWESKNFRGYISAGGQVEKLVSGKATTHYTMDDGYSGTLIEDISDNRLLFSALASIGAEYKLGKDFSLYAEPGIHYYFKNGNGLNTHYNDKPLNINITVGFRFHWNK